MAPTTTATKQQLAVQLAADKSSSSPSPPPPRCSGGSSSSQGGGDVDDDDDVARQLVMGRWRSSLSLGLRAALACTIVGLVSLYAPAAVRRHITFPAFSYVVTVILVTDAATLGAALRGAASALHGTLMGAAPSVAALWLAHAAGAAESAAATSAVVALTAFAVALPAPAVGLGPVAKRIALGQAIIIYVARFRRGERPSRDLALLHPANVAACTALGVAAALLAVLLPWPRLVTREARGKSRAYKVLAAERVRVLADAFAAAVAAEGEGEVCSRRRRWEMAACMSEANRLASASATLLKGMNAIKEDLQWERAAVVDDNKSSIEMPLTGMQIALATMQQEADDGRCRHGRNNASNNKENMVVGLVMAMRDQIRLALLTPNNNKRRKSSSSPLSLFGSSSITATLNKSLCHLPTPTSYDYEEQQPQLASFLFLFSLYQLHQRCCGGGDGPETSLTKEAAANNRQVAPAATTATGQELLLEQPLPDDEQDDDEEEAEQVGQEDPSSQAEAAAEEDDKATKTTTATKRPSAGCVSSWRWPRRRRLVAAAKCGFSLGLAVLLGLLFSSDHGFWSGLIVATTMTAGRESTWAVALARAHGTALGSVYGVLCCVLMSRQQRLLTMDLRFVAILPWMVLAAFLKRSRAYGPAGGVAAALSVVIIVGRRYDEAPMAFTVARLVETFIGISCAVLADLAFQPGARPSAQAREQLARCVAALADCCRCHVVAESSSSEALLKRAQQELALLRKRAAEAGSEPTYLWLPPFPAACYDKIQGSLSRMAQLLQLYHQARRHQQQVDVNGDTNTIQLRRFSSLASTSLSHCLHMLAPAPGKEAKMPKAQVIDDDDDDLEAGTAAGGVGCCCYKDDDEVVGSFLAQAGEPNLLLLNDDDDSVQRPEERLLLVCCLGSVALCMGEILKEAQRLEAHIIDLNNLQLSTR